MQWENGSLLLRGCSDSRLLFAGDGNGTLRARGLFPWSIHSEDPIRWQGWSNGERIHISRDPVLPVELPRDEAVLVLIQEKEERSREIRMGNTITWPKLRHSLPLGETKWPWHHKDKRSIWSWGYSLVVKGPELHLQHCSKYTDSKVKGCSSRFKPRIKLSRYYN